MIFDKTGTLTAGRPVLVESIALGKVSTEDALKFAAAIEQGSEHPLGQALHEAAAGAELPPATDFRAYTGQGMEASINGRRMRIGKPEFAGDGLELPRELSEWVATGDTVIALADVDGWLAGFRLADKPRESAASAVAILHELGLRLAVLSGDAASAVEKVTKQLGIEFGQGGMTPEAKHDYIHSMQRDGTVVAMVGDGVNDAPVLAQAHVSIAMGGGTDLARSQADIVLLSDDLRQLAQGVTLARRALRVIRQNLAWAFAYNLLAIPLAMTGHITPWMAGIGMSASSLLVVLNALRLQDKD
jgi:Cu2+-exporting ATPase